MSLSVKFNDVELGNCIHVTQGFTPYIGTDWSPAVNDSQGVTRGNDFKYTTYGAKTIDMPFEIRDDLPEKYDKLQKVLNVTEPKPLIFGSLPDRVFYAIPVGSLDFEQISYLGSGTITWMIPDGLAHASVEKSFPAVVNAKGGLEAIIVNDGTEAVPIDYTITHQHENGYIGIVSERGAIQIGKIEEADGETYEKSETLVNDTCWVMEKDWVLNQATTVKVVSEHKQIGTVGCRDAYLYATDYGNGAQWHGPSLTKGIPADSRGHVGAKNCTLSWHHYYSTGTINDLGVVQFLMTDKNKKNVAAVTCFKNVSGQNFGHVHMYVNGIVLKEIDLDCGYWNRITGLDYGRSSISKFGSRFEFDLGGQVYTFYVPEMENIEVTEISTFIGSCAVQPPVGANIVYSMTFVSHSVKAWRDIPNRYQPGDVVFVDGEEGKIYVNGAVCTKDAILGSKYFLAPPGEMKVQFSCSDFCSQKPEITAKIREAYL